MSATTSSSSTMTSDAANAHTFVPYPWYYLDESRNQHGPVSLSDMQKLLLGDEESDGINGMTLLWSPQLTQWTALSEVPGLIETLHGHVEEGKNHVNASQSSQGHENSQKASQQTIPGASSTNTGTATSVGQQWYYVDGQLNRQGPVSAQGLASLVCAGQIDTDTLVWTAGMGDWIPISMEGSLSDFIGQVFREQVQSRNSTRPEKKDTAAETEKVESQISTEASKKADQMKQGQQKRKAKSSKKKPKDNPWVYVTGLPTDITFSELHDTFKKCGILKRDIMTNEPRIKIYKDESGNPKGDASICYLQEASVGLALDILDDSEIRPGYRIHVEQAEFQPNKKAKHDSSTKPDEEGPKLTKEQREKLIKIRRKEQETALSWAEDGSTSTGLKIVVLKNMFSPQTFYDEYGSPAELKEEIQKECQRECGDVSKVTVFENNPEGVVLVKFKNDGDAAKCLHLMSDRTWKNRRILAEFYDGISDYRCGQVQADEEEEEERLDEFGAWLESGAAEQPPEKI